MKRNHLADGDGAAEGPGGGPGTTSGVCDDAQALTLKAYQELGAYVWRLLAKAGLEDAKGTHQEVFMKVYESILGEGPPGDMRALIRTITLRLVRKEWRDRGRHPRLGGQIDTDALPGGWRNPEELVIGAREAREVREGIDEVKKVSKADAGLLQRVGLDGEDVAGVARKRRVPEKTIYSGFDRARESLRTVIERVRARKGGVE